MKQIKTQPQVRNALENKLQSNNNQHHKNLSMKYKLKANLFIKGNSSLCQTYYTNPNTILHQGIEDINLYEKQNKKWKKNYSLLNEETQDFFQRYLVIQKKKKQCLVTKTGVNPFSELISQYRRKGYKIPDLSTKNNLFKQSVCLIEPNKINTYYQYYKDLSKVTDKGALYIDKADVFLKKYKANDMKLKKQPMKTFERRGTLFRAQMLQMTWQETEKENKELAQYNKTMESFITSSLVNIDSIGPKNPKTTKNNQTNSIFFYSHKNSQNGTENSIMNTPKLLKNRVQIYKYLIDRESNGIAFHKNLTKRLQTNNMMSQEINEDSSIIKKSRFQKKNLSIDSHDISIIERPSTRSLENECQKKRNEQISSIRDQVNLDENTKNLIKESDPNAFLKLIKNKIQFKVNQFDYESLRRMETIHPSNSSNIRIKLKKLQKAVRHINKLDKELIQVINTCTN